MVAGDDELLDEVDEEDDEEDDELDEELPDVDELCAVCVDMGGDIGELCSGLWLPSESSLGNELGGVRGRLKACPLLARLAFGSILMFSFDMILLLCDLSRLWDADERCIEPFCGVEIKVTIK